MRLFRKNSFCRLKTIPRPWLEYALELTGHHLADQPLAEEQDTTWQMC